MGNPIFVQLHQFLQSFQTKRFIQLWNAHPVIGTVDAFEVFFRAKQQNLAFVSPVSLQPFKHLLAIVEAFGKRIQFNGAIRYDSGIMPSLSLGIVHNKHVIGSNGAKSQFCLILRLLFRCSRAHNLDFTHL